VERIGKANPLHFLLLKRSAAADSEEPHDRRSCRRRRGWSYCFLHTCWRWETSLRRGGSRWRTRHADV